MTQSPLAAFHRSNALTYVSLSAAVGAIACAGNGNSAAAGSLIALAVMADTFDGKFARLFYRTAGERTIGAHLDSLSDAIAFGAAPAACMLQLAPRSDGAAELAWWAVSVLFGVCAITRLAFYNLTHEESSGFIGLPAPVAALVWASALLFDPTALTSALVMLATAAAMVAPIPIPRPTGAALALFAMWPLGVMAAFSLQLRAIFPP